MEKCEDCGKESIDVKYRPCPYAQDMYNEIELVCICDDCAYERGRDV